MLPLRHHEWAGTADYPNFSDEAAAKAVRDDKEARPQRDGRTFPGYACGTSVCCIEQCQFLYRRAAMRQGKLKAVEWARIRAKVVEQWTLVDGVFTADPESSDG